MAKRYDLWMYYDEWQEDESDDGEWVKYEDHAAELATLRAENKMMRDALRFYASPKTYYAPNLKDGEDFSCAPLLSDRGAIAKEALK